MYTSYKTDPSIGALAIFFSSVGVILAFIRLCKKCAAADDQQRHSTAITTPARVVPVQQRLPLPAQSVIRPFTSQPVSTRSTVITIHDYEPPAPTYQPYLMYPPMPTFSSLTSSSSPLSYQPLGATSLSPAPTCPPMSQSQPPLYPPMARTQSTSIEADSIPPAYSVTTNS
ncbi:MAG: hypothetical protein JOS17DRAFT_736104 [Linnemannia elongata]|nr:MAG: hypothetical protein JOS17DRAFT_736104 [Linnemannia elongata]